MVGLVGFERRGLKETIKTRNVQPFVLKFKDITFFKKKQKKTRKKKKKESGQRKKKKKEKKKRKKSFP